MKKIFIYILILVLASLTMTAKDTGGKNLPDKIKIENTNLNLNGSGVIKKFFFKIYAIGLYLQEKSEDPQKILKSDKAMSIRMHFIRNDIDVNKIRESFDEGFRKSTGNNFKGIQNELNTLKSCITNNIKEDDIVQFDYLPGTGTRVYFNKQLKATLAGINFKSALFGIWIGNDPRDDGVKEKLLGK